MDRPKIADVIHYCLRLYTVSDNKLIKVEKMYFRKQSTVK